jgi:peptide/nickel transport system substrate-binding protein
MVEAGSGTPLAFEALARSRGQERLMLAYAESLRRVGIAMSIRQVDDAQYWARLKNFDFDLIQWGWGASLSPGNEQINRWSSAAADVQGSLNYPGVKSPAVDAMIEALLKAREREDFEAAVRALDRALLSGDYVIPLFHLKQQWVAHWAHLVPPATTPLSGYSIDTWWDAADKR